MYFDKPVSPEQIRKLASNSPHENPFYTNPEIRAMIEGRGFIATFSAEKKHFAETLVRMHADKGMVLENYGVYVQPKNIDPATQEASGWEKIEGGDSVWLYSLERE